ncbi:MAG: hypothetical protein IKW19_08880 [Akkermansia sp.]|nr:hypothetical protein [Akkermansia sp.]
MDYIFLIKGILLGLSFFFICRFIYRLGVRHGIAFMLDNDEAIKRQFDMICREFRKQQQNNSSNNAPA